MSTSAAQDEFDALTNQSARYTRHHSDASSSSPSSGDENTSHSRNRTIKTSRLQRNDSSDEDDEPEAPFRQGANDHIPLQSNAANTGPKGVISDAKDTQREARRAARMGNDVGREKVVVRSGGRALGRERHWTDDADGAEEEEEEEDDEELDADDADDFMRKWKEQRLAEMKTSSKPRGGHRGGYGTLETVDGLGYLEAIESTSRSEVVVVYIYDVDVGKLPSFARSGVG